MIELSYDITSVYIEDWIFLMKSCEFTKLAYYINGDKFWSNLEKNLKFLHIPFGNSIIANTIVSNLTDKSEKLDMPYLIQLKDWCNRKGKITFQNQIYTHFFQIHLIQLNLDPLTWLILTT